MSALIVGDTGNSGVVDADTEVHKLQDLVRKLQVQSQILEKQSTDTDAENSPYVVDANCNTDIFQCATPPRGGVLREQQLNSNNTRHPARTNAATDDNIDNARETMPQQGRNFADDSDTENLSLDTVPIIDVDGNLSDDEESWSAILITCIVLGNYGGNLVLSEGH